MMYSVEVREAQATACLESAAKYQRELLSAAEKLTGNKEAAMELFQQTCLNCHDAIQHRGFAGTEYRFYLLTALRNLYRRGQQLERLRQGLDGLEEAPDRAPASDLRGELVDQMAAEVREKFSARQRMAMRLHLDEHSFKEISELMGGGDQSWIRRQVLKIKVHLRETFGPVWDQLEE